MLFSAASVGIGLSGASAATTKIVTGPDAGLPPQINNYAPTGASLKNLLSFLVALGCALGGVAGAKAAELRTLHTFGPGPHYSQAPLVQGADGATYGTTTSGGQDQNGTVFKITATGEMVVLHSFIRSNNLSLNGGSPQAGLTSANDGNFYGTTVVGGTNGHGTIFRITPQGALTTLHHFGNSQNDYDATTLVQGNDGYLYGTTEGTDGLYAGIAFKISPAGAYTQLHRFSLGTNNGNGLDGGFPGPLMKAQDGNLYGVARTGGANGDGSLFRVNPAGGVDRIYSFEYPYRGSRTRLVELNAGEFYGTSTRANGSGIIFRLTLGGVFTLLHTFTDDPVAGFTSGDLVVGSDGNLYGTCSTGRAPSDSGIVFRITPSGVFDVLHTFTGGLDGGWPRAGLVRTGEQTFRGTTTQGGIYGRGTIFEVTAQGGFTTLFSFSPNSDGAGGSGAMVEVEDGSFYGAMREGGLFGWGTIFRLTPDGELTTLYNFQGAADRGLPGRLVLGPDGFFYGVTHYFVDARGTLFKVSRTGAFTTLRNFVSDQEVVEGGLVLGNDGNFYATVWHGGASRDGAIAKITPAGEFTVIHEFVQATDGSEPYSTLVQDGNGFLYGSTPFGGANGHGTIFKCSPAGDFTVLHHFIAQEDRPLADLLLGSDGSIYGATGGGGAYYSGTIFRLATNGAFTVLHDFESQFGAHDTTLTIASDDTLYGASGSSGNGEGILFQVAPSGAFTVLHSFTGGSEGGHPGALIQASNGLLYGSTASGASGRGTLFSLSLQSPNNLLNISTRMRVETGNNVLIGGFIVTGTAPKNVVIRGIGPSLGSVGISDALADPTLELRGSDGSLIAANDNWQTDPAQAAQLTALGFGLPHPNEAGIVATLQPNAYTAVMAGQNNGTGVGLVEVYDVSQEVDAQLANISTRGLVQTGAHVMIGGFILGGGDGDTNVIVRGIGPSLADLGLSPVLANPTLALHDGNGALLIANDNWLDDSDQAVQLTAAGLAPTHWQEAGIRASLPLGPFTAILAGQNGGTGIGLIEIYNLH